MLAILLECLDKNGSIDDFVFSLRDEKSKTYNDILFVLPSEIKARIEQDSRNTK